MLNLDRATVLNLNRASEREQGTEGGARDRAASEGHRPTGRGKRELGASLNSQKHPYPHER